MRIKNGWDIRINEVRATRRLAVQLQGAARPAPRFYTISLLAP